MKKVLISAVLVILVMVMTVACGSHPDNPDSSAESVKSLSVFLTPHMNDITVEWENPGKINIFEIYRVDVTEDVLDPEKDMTFHIADYEKIAEVSGEFNSYTDTDVQPDHYYAYIVKAYLKENDKIGIAYISNEYEDQYMCQCCGLSAPELINGGYGEFDTNSPEALYLYYQIYYGVEPTSVILYRRAKGETKYQKIDFETVEEICEGSGEIKDSSVEPGTIYFYKIKTVSRNDGKDYFSKASEALRIPAVNFSGKYAVSKIPVSDNPDKVIVKFKSDKLNGQLRVSCFDSDIPDEENYIRAVAFSADNKTWISMEDQDALISAGDTVFLQFSGKDIASAEELYIDSDDGFIRLDYDGPGAGCGIMRIDFAGEKAEVYQNFD